MTTDRQMQIFELIAVHGCTQAEAGSMVDPPISHRTVKRDLRSLYVGHPELIALRDYLHLNDDFSLKNEPSNIISYDSGMDYDVKAKF